jgi:hypothetical protein
MSAPEEPNLQTAIRADDTFGVARAADKDTLDRLITAESLLEKLHARRKRLSRFASMSQAMVGYVALAGFFANAYQNWTNKEQAQRQSATEQERWNKEFKRAQDADKYRAFFETSALATDTANADKRLVGYTLLKEFVSDKDYNSKATIMLEESLFQELRANTADRGLDPARYAAAGAIVTSLAETSDCKSLERSARSVQRLAKLHRAKGNDAEDSATVFRVFVTQLLGRAVQVCPPKDLIAVRRPLRDTLTKVPELASLKGKPTVGDVNARLVQIMRDDCAEEITSTANPDCTDIGKRYQKFCGTLKGADALDDAAACQLAAGWPGG